MPPNSAMRDAVPSLYVIFEYCGVIALMDAICLLGSLLAADTDTPNALTAVLSATCTEVFTALIVGAADAAQRLKRSLRCPKTASI